MPQFTKAAIIKSFSKLLDQKSFEKITVKDIVEDCGVNRKTFYYYFARKSANLLSQKPKI